MLQQHRDFKAYARIRVLEFRVDDRSGLGLLPGFLRMWLVEHEFGLDRELVSWIRANSDDEVAAPE
ncbi:MAG: hypothetical protein U1E29_15130 [Coriobacteriia bacterium]|nr:hypothetical protein [Coriobacteriia bacterium]